MGHQQEVPVAAPMPVATGTVTPPREQSAAAVRSSDAMHLPPTPLDAPRLRLTRPSEMTVLVMVGLPARGKSFISKKLERFLLWRGEHVRIFNVGERRRKYGGGAKEQTASFFAEDNTRVREEIAQGVLSEMVEWLRHGDAAPVPAGAPPHLGRVARALSDDQDTKFQPRRFAIFDATNSSMKRRRVVMESLSRELGGECQVVFVESICNDAHVIERNLLQKVSTSPDYAHMDREVALSDLRQRIAQYENQYESLSTKERLSFIRLFNLSSELHLNLIYGPVARLVPYMMGIHTGRRPIWLVRAAHCEDADGNATPDGDESETDRPTRDGSRTFIVPRSAALSEDGVLFAQRLGAFCKARSRAYSEGLSGQHPSGWSMVEEASLAADERGAASHSSASSSDDPGEGCCAIYTSTLPRAIQTATFVPQITRPHASSALNPLDRGVAYGLTEEEFALNMADDYEHWRADKRHMRFPGGESYADLIARLEPILIELEQQTAPVLVVSHVSTLQLLASYFTGSSIDEALETSIPHHAVVELRPETHSMMWGKELIHLDDNYVPLEPPQLPSRRAPLATGGPPSA